jgi:dTMP kinase
VFRQIAAQEPERCVLIDANAEPEEVADRIWQAVRLRLLEPARSGAKSA